MPAISLRLTQDLERRLSRLARETGRKRSELLRVALEAYLAAADRRRIDSLLATAAEMADPVSSLEMVEEALVADNEALEAFEGSGTTVGEDPWPAKWWKA